MEWIKITKENVHTLVYGETIKYFDGEEWCETTITDFEMDYGYIGIERRRVPIFLTDPPFNENVYVLR